MDIFKSNKMFFILMGVLIVVLIGSTVYWWMERGQAKKAKIEVENKTGVLTELRRIDPTPGHVKLLEATKNNTEQTYNDIVKSLISWNDYETESLSHNDVVAYIRDRIQYKDIKESTVRKWFEDKKMKSFLAPDGSPYVLRNDLDIFLKEIIKMTPSEDFPKELIDALIAATARVQLKEEPTTFLGELTKLQLQLTEFASNKEHNIIIKDQAQVLYLSFEKYLRDGKPPDPEVDLTPLIKQRSAVRDILFLLVASKVFEIQSITFTDAPGKERMSDFYVGRDFEVVFYATYPAVARFMNMILNPQKQDISFQYKDKDSKEYKEFRESLPKNLLIVTDIMYKSEEAETEQKRQSDYLQKIKEEEDRRRMGGTPITGGGGALDPRRGRGSMDRGNPVPVDDFTKYRDIEKGEAAKTKNARPPDHVILKVTMTISFVDLMGYVTGETYQKPIAGK